MDASRWRDAMARNQTWAFEPTVQERRRALSEALRKAWSGTAVLKLTKGQYRGLVAGDRCHLQ